MPQGKTGEAGVAQLEKRCDIAIISQHREDSRKEEGIPFLPGGSDKQP